MQASIFISKRSFLGVLPWVVALAGALSSSAHAEGKKDRSLPPEDDDFSSTPFTEYGSFNEDAEEDAETRFLQYGRLFGVSAGVGSEGALGNRGQLWQGGFPMLELKMHYWFDFHLALDMGFSTAKHNYESTADSGLGIVDVNTTRIFVDLKYYFDVKNLSAPISFANPYILGGIGSFSKSETGENDPDTSNSDSAMLLGAGVGLEFAIKPKKTYFEVEGKLMTATFKDTNTTTFQNSRGLDDLSGPFFTFTGSFLFTW